MLRQCRACIARPKVGLEHGVEQLDSFEPMRYWVSHQAIQGNSGVGEVGQELKPLGIVVGDPDGDTECSFAT